MIFPSKILLQCLRLQEKRKDQQKKRKDQIKRNQSQSRRKVRAGQATIKRKAWQTTATVPVLKTSFIRKLIL